MKCFTLLKYIRDYPNEAIKADLFYLHLIFITFAEL